jgi:Tfp pilus assembly protein PilN
MLNLKKRSQPKTESPCGIAYDAQNGQVVLAEFAEGGTGFDIYRVMENEPRSVNITSTDIRTTLTGGNAHTDQAQLPVGADAPDEAILRALISATEADPHSFAFSRTPDSRIVVTQVEQTSLSDLVRRTEQWLETQQPPHVVSRQVSISAETRTRAIARVWKASRNVPSETGTVGFLLMGPNDYAVALWSEESGLVYETEEVFERGAGMEIKCLHARDMFRRFIADPSLAKLRLGPVSRVVVSASADYGDMILQMLHQAEYLRNVTVEPVSLELGASDEDASLDQPTALAIGALLQEDYMPACNLAVSPQARLDEINLAAAAREQVNTRRKARAAMLAIAVPLVAVFAFLGACWMDYNVETSQLRAKIDEETQIAAQLKQANADYESSKANFGTFRALLDNLITLRQRQPATHQLLSDLNARWPQDPTWYISEINVKGGNVEIKGRTKNEQSITSFAKSLEFSNGLFSAILTRNNVQGNAGPGQFPGAASTTDSSIREFSVLATYAPLATPGKPMPAAAPVQQVPMLQQPQIPGSQGPNAIQQGQMQPGQMMPGQMRGGAQPMAPSVPNIPAPPMPQPR